MLSSASRPKRQTGGVRSAQTLGITGTHVRVRMIQIVPYTEAWPLAFESEAAALRRVMGTQAVRIEHVGSTAVPGLAAKPVIDIQISVESLHSPELFQASLATLGYRFVSIPEFYDPEYPFFAKPGQWPSTHHVHLCVQVKN